jgi:hypothetical protein
LPPDARFCHKCGKPQFEWPAPEPEEQLAPPPVRLEAQIPTRPPVGFGNLIAVRIGALVALVTFIAALISTSFGVSQGVLLFPLFCLVAAGFLAVYLYSRRTGETLTLRSGARMGWMTGFFTFVPMLLLLTITVLAASDPGFQTQFSEMLKARGADPQTETMLGAFRNPASVISMAVVSFIVFTLFPALGGMIGAKLLGHRPQQ